MKVREIITPRRRGWVIAAAAVAAVAALLLWPMGPALEMVDRTGKSVFCSRVDVGQEFVLSFVHSVNRRPVYDTLRVERDHLVILRSRFDSFGAGMPTESTADGTLAIAKDGWLEWTVNRPVPDITVRVGWVAGHTLTIEGREIRLADLAEPGSPLTIRVRDVRMLDFFKGRCAQ
jgi:hypothetical protein